MKVHWLQHAEHEELGCIAPWLAGRGDTVTHTRPYAGEALPKASGFDALIVMGGPMNVHEHEAHPWLMREKALIRAALAARKRVLGICLGAQLVADALGAPVTRNAETEIGWYEVRMDEAGRRARVFAGFPATFMAFHWHGDTFAIPAGCECLMSSDGCANQAFASADGRVVGIQFHLEVTAANAREWLRLESPSPARYVQPAAEILAPLENFAANNRLMLKLLDSWIAA